MKKEIIINSNTDENRIAIIEDGKLAELFIENEEYERVIGDIYLGKVAKVIPGIKAAFIDLGFKQDAFLHFSDVGDQADDMKAILGQDSEVDDDDDEDETETTPRKNQHNKRKPMPRLERGQKIIVQITKEPVGNKGVRVTSKVSLPGRYLVFLPFENKVNASKQIQNMREKRRLKNIVRNYRIAKGLEFGAILRTVAEEQDEAAILEDLEGLYKNWKEIEKQVKTGVTPLLLYKDLTVTTSVIRDLFRDDVEIVRTDSKKLFKEIQQYVKINSPELLDKVELYKGNKALFDNYNIEAEIHLTLGKRVPLKLGGHLVIEKTEAMYVIDVNSGKYAKSKDQETNSLKTNLEASREIVRQIRLRDLGGIIVVDFIDVYDDKNKKKVYDELKKEFKKDRAKVTILPMSEFGLIQITRQRVRENVVRSITEQCPLCGGSGIIESSDNIITRIERWIKRFKLDKKRITGKLLLKVHPMVYSTLREGTISSMTKMSFKYLLRITLEEDSSLAFQDFKFIHVKTGEDITANYS
ncbi:MAG: Rne/Rng family ribonuclease [Ignavibacteria bacterium]|nr:Rne/Rng family ribonuclease [Ignavibacteria bacterium]